MIFKVKTPHYHIEQLTYTIEGVTRTHPVHVLDYSTYQVYDNVVDLVNAHAIERGYGLPDWKWLSKKTILDELDLPVSIDTIRKLWNAAPWKRYRNSWRGAKRHHHRQAPLHTNMERREIIRAEQRGVHVRGKRKHLPDSWENRHSSWGRRNWKHFRRTQYHAQEGSEESV